MTAWVYIVLSSGCTILVANLLKYLEFRRLNTLRVLSINYMTASVLAFAVAGGVGMNDELSANLPVLFLAALTGMVFIGNFFVYSKSTYQNGVGISVAAMRISLVLPVLLSTLWYSEYLSYREWTGVILVFITLYLLLPAASGSGVFGVRRSRAIGLLLLLFTLTGIGDSSLKVFEADFSTLLTAEQFMGFVFLFAFVAGITAVAAAKVWTFTRSELILGVIISIPNLYSAIFLLEALSLAPGAIVYTAANLLTVIGATLFGVWIWKDRLTTAQWAGIGFTMIAIALLV